MTISRLGSERDHFGARCVSRKRVLTLCVGTLAAALAFGPLPAAAIGRLANVEIVTRADQRVQPVYTRNGAHWVVGTPGEEYTVRVCNPTGGRLLAVTSVDGVNVISGDTAAPSQSGYVLDPYACLSIEGWRKSLSRTAAFYFTDIGDSYAARTGRPDNVGVIGVALFREKQPPVVYRPQPREKIAAKERAGLPPAAAEPNAAPKSLPSDGARTLAESARGAIAPAPQLGTGHGRSETSYAQTVGFERDTTAPAETIAIRYDRRENLVAMGILPPPYVAGTPPPNPFPVWDRFAPDPPNR